MKNQNTTTEAPKTARGNHTICVAFINEEEYQNCVNDVAKYRQVIEGWSKNHPELFPKGFSEGWEFHSAYRMSKQKLIIKRVKVKASGGVYGIRPSFVLPYGVGKTAEVEKALYLREFGVPYEALAYVFGRDANYWERIFLGLGRNSVVGTTVKSEDRLPMDLVGDEKVSWQTGQEVYITTTVGGGCFLGVAVAGELDAAALAAGYGEFKREAENVSPGYVPRTVCLDGCSATQLAWKTLFPTITVILCFLHGVLKAIDRCSGDLRQQVVKRLWFVYHASTQAEFTSRVQELKVWAEQSLAGTVQEMVLKIWRQRAHYIPAYAHPTAHRTSNALDRLMNHQDRLLYLMHYLHGTQSARLAVRAMALLWNFHPYSDRLRREYPSRRSPFADLNGFEYHPNWLHNLLIASSLGGFRS